MDEMKLLSAISEMLEKNEVAQKKRDEQIQTRLDEMSTRLDTMSSRLIKVESNQESLIIPRLELLYEGHTSILQKIERDPRVQSLQDRIDVLETTLKYLSNEVKHLKNVVNH